MEITIRNRIYLSFSVLMFLFVVSGFITIRTNNENRKQSAYVSTVVHPLTEGLVNFNRILVDSRNFSTNWVYFQFHYEDKKALKEIHVTHFPALKASLNYYAAQQHSKEVRDSLLRMFAAYDQIILVQKEIMQTLNDFADYNDPSKRFEMEMMAEDNIIPGTSALIGTLNNIMKMQEAIRINANADLQESSTRLTRIIWIMAISVIVIGAFFAVYMSRLVVNPINVIRKIIVDMGKGETRRIDYKITNNEIGRMIESVNNLSGNLQASANFATQIGERNYQNDYKPLSEKDTLGKALLAMRDNLKMSDERLNEAQKIAKLASWEYDFEQSKVYFSDEVYAIVDDESRTIRARAIMELFFDSDLEKWKALYMDSIQRGKSFAMEAKMLTLKNVQKIVYIRTKFYMNEDGTPARVIGIMQDITSQKKKEDELRENNAQLTKTNMELDKFVYSVSHDLRAPLSSMLGIVQLTEEDVEDDFVKSNLGHVKGSILKLDGFIQDILAYSRNSRSAVTHKAIDFNLLLNEISRNLKYMGTEATSIKIDTQVVQTGVFLSDESRLSIILNNLISNAIRYANPAEAQPFVSIDVFCNDYEAIVTIKDNGIGIKKEFHEKVFDMFYRVSENSVGSGLGLYIVKEAVIKLGGSIDLQSEPGVGTTFKINFQSNK